MLAFRNRNRFAFERWKIPTPGLFLWPKWDIFES